MINIKKLYKTILLLSLIVLMSGCFDYSELNNMDIIVGMGIAKVNDEYEVTYEVINTSIDKDNTEAKKSFTVSESDKELIQAINKTTSKLNKKPYFEHMRVILINPSLDILDLSDYFTRSNVISSNFYLVLTDEPKSILEYTTNDQKINSEEVYNILTNISYVSLNNYFDFQVNNIINKKKDITIPYISFEDKLIFKSYGLYQKNKFLTYLEDSKLLMNSFYQKDTDISIEDKDNVIRIYKSKYKITIKDNIKIKIDATANIEKLSDDLSLREEISFKELESSFKEKLTNEMMEYLEYLQQINSDILGINNLSYLKTGKYDDDYFSKTKINLDINLKINRPGLTIRKAS